MIQFNQIRKFLIIKNKKSKKLFIWTFEDGKKKKINLKKNNSFIVGYEYDNNGTEGEYLKLEIKNSNILIANDLYSSFNCYIFSHKKSEKIISNSLDEIFGIKKNFKINPKKIYEYFSYGYIPSSQDTIYRNIKLLRRGSSVG